MIILLMIIYMKLRVVLVCINYLFFFVKVIICLATFFSFIIGLGGLMIVKR